MNDGMLQVAKMVDFLFKGLISPAERQNLCRDFGAFFWYQDRPRAVLGFFMWRPWEQSCTARAPQIYRNVHALVNVCLVFAFLKIPDLGVDARHFMIAQMQGRGLLAQGAEGLPDEEGLAVGGLEIFWPNCSELRRRHP